MALSLWLGERLIAPRARKLEIGPIPLLISGVGRRPPSTRVGTRAGASRLGPIGGHAKKTLD
jgi:hypothetical protein